VKPAALTLLLTLAGTLPAAAAESKPVAQRGAGCPPGFFHVEPIATTGAVVNCTTAATSTLANPPCKFRSAATSHVICATSPRAGRE
jgi:hypothetical protein